MIRPLSLVFLCAAALCLWLPAQDTKNRPEGSQIPGPDRAGEAAAWLADVRHWRDEKRIRIAYDGSEYARPEFAWTQRSFIQPQMMVEDRYFYDPVAGRYSVDRYLADVEKRYGGIDSVLVWQSYPNIGIDNRSQYDLLRDLPGGVAGVRQMIADFHKHGVRVLFPMMMWDQGTRAEDVPNWDATARLMAEVGADGVNGDTMAWVPLGFRKASDKTGHPVVFEPEHLTMEEAVAWNNMGWAYWKYSFVPAISKNKLLEPRHMVHVCNRWARDKVDDLQHAFFNGAGYESWENVWGIWNQITPRDAEALRRISKIERQFAPLLVSPEWEPHTPTLRYGVFATRFPTDGATLWTVVNRNEYSVEGAQLRVPHQPGRTYFDVWNGVELAPEVSGDNATLSFPLEAHGYGAIVSTSQQDSNLDAFVTQMHALAAKPLSSYSHEWKVLPQHLADIPSTRPSASAPPGMVAVPGGKYEFQVSGIEIEGGNHIGVDVQYPWEDAPRRHHRHTLQIRPFFIDRYPVTNAEFKKFLDASHYRPADDHNFLRDWKNGAYPSGAGNQPVVWVALEDARAYAAWAGKRLPHEWEWQYAAQGNDGRLYPWGNEWNSEVVPPPHKGRDLRFPTNVDAFPKGASPFGVEDLVGNVWQWTDEVIDEHTRAGILRGGSFYQPQGSHWYFPQAYKLTEHGKYLLMAPAKDRAGTVGFRCVVDSR